MEQLKKTYCCVGLMSGTSLDGLDMALCLLHLHSSDKWTYEFLKTKTQPYTDKWRTRLQQAPVLDGFNLQILHREYGSWIAQHIVEFLSGEGYQPDFIASHGHTVFHQPEKKLNLQVGDGAVIAAKTGITTISDFRSLDICLNGQGAPLVPIGDMLLFKDYVACVNLGGFSNVSSQVDGERKAWDISPLNFVINRLMNKLGLEMDRDGDFGRQGKIIDKLITELNNLNYYSLKAPKSLGQEWVENEFIPLLRLYNTCSLEDVVRTCYEHFANVMANDLNQLAIGRILFTGGGVYNKFFMELIRQKVKGEVIIPDKQLIEYKEALVFALLGALRIGNKINCLASVTGADKNSSSGSIYVAGN